jgi:hypothetical protein
MKSSFPQIRRAHRVLRMVSDLHRMGFQKLRVMPYVHPLAYRVAVAPAEWFLAANGIALRDEELGRAAVYSSASENRFFDWSDATQDTSIQLAAKFVQRFPEVAARGSGSDWKYAGWLADLIGVLATGDWLPVARREYMSDEELRKLRTLPLHGWSEGGLGDVAREFPIPTGGEPPHE